MTKQEIITLLIKDYEEAIEKCRNIQEYKAIKEYLNSQKLSAGICFAARERHDIDIYYSEWVGRHGFYWAKRPEDLTNKKSIIKSLEARLSILKTELEIPE